MVCNNCREIVLQDEEVKIEDLTICKKCIKKLIEREISDRCHICSKIIHRGDLIYEVSIGLNAEYIVGANETKKIVQCDWCYQKWLRKQEKEEKHWKWKLKRLGLGIYAILLPILIIVFFWPDLTDKFCKAHWIVKILLPILLIITPFIVYSMILRIISRYKRNNGSEKNKRK